LVSSNTGRETEKRKKRTKTKTRKKTNLPQWINLLKQFQNEKLSQRRKNIPLQALIFKTTFSNEPSSSNPK
jgi:hypothetical protein